MQLRRHACALLLFSAIQFSRQGSKTRLGLAECPSSFLRQFSAFHKSEAPGNWLGVSQTLSTTGTYPLTSASFASSGTRALNAARNAVRDLATAPDQISQLVAGPELKALQRIGGVALNVTNRDAWQHLGMELESARADYLTAADAIAAGPDAGQ